MRGRCVEEFSITIFFPTKQSRVFLRLVGSNNLTLAKSAACGTAGGDAVKKGCVVLVPPALRGVSRHALISALYLQRKQFTT
jgi:hypothetical protein